MAVDTDCALCSPRKACEFHAAGTPEELLSAVVHSLRRKKGGLALARFITSAIAGLEKRIPPQIMRAIDDVEVDDLEAYVQKKMAHAAQNELSPKDLRELAGCFIALAMLADDDDDEGEDE